MNWVTNTKGACHLDLMMDVKEECLLEVGPL